MCVVCFLLLDFHKKRREKERERFCCDAILSSMVCRKGSSEQAEEGGEGIESVSQKKRKNTWTNIQQISVRTM